MALCPPTKKQTRKQNKKGEKEYCNLLVGDSE